MGASTQPWSEKRRGERQVGLVRKVGWGAISEPCGSVNTTLELQEIARQYVLVRISERPSLLVTTCFTLSHTEVPGGPSPHLEPQKG